MDNQELSVGDVKRMKKEKEQLKKTVMALKEQEDGLNQQLWEGEMSYSKQHEQVKLFKGELRPEISLLHMKVLTMIKAKSNVFL